MPFIQHLRWCATIVMSLPFVALAHTPAPPAATAAETLKCKASFKAELLYSVPKDTQGSWVNMTVDPRGRLIVSDQYGPL